MFETYVSVNLEHNSYLTLAETRRPRAVRQGHHHGDGRGGQEITPAEGKLTTTYTIIWTC